MVKNAHLTINPVEFMYVANYSLYGGEGVFRPVGRDTSRKVRVSKKNLLIFKVSLLMFRYVPLVLRLLSEAEARGGLQV